MRPVLLVPLLLLAACVDDRSDGGDALVPGAPLGELAVEQDAGDGSPPSRWSLVCGDDTGDGTGADGGSHPDPRAACEHLRAADEPFAPLPADRMCAEIYGGPQTAHVTGRWRGETVDLRLSRVDGCAIAQWDGLGPLLPGPVGVDPPA